MWNIYCNEDFHCLQRHRTGYKLQYKHSLWDVQLSDLLFLGGCFFLLGDKAEKRTTEFIKAAVGAGELGRRKETNGRAPEKERAWV